MSTDWGNPLNILDFSLKIAATVFALVYFIFIFRQYRQKPTRARKLLSIIFICVGAVTILYVLDYLIPVNVFNYIFSFVIIFMGGLNIGLLYFATEIFASEQYEKSTRNKLINGGFSVAQIVIGLFSAVYSWINDTVNIIIMMFFFLLLSVGLCIYLITNSFKLASRITKTNPDLVKYKRSIQCIGGLAIMIFLVYTFLAIETLQGTFTLWGRIIWIFMMLAMFFIYMGFIKPTRSSEAQNPQ